MAHLIKFIDLLGNTPEMVYPYPAKRDLPEWYKNLPPYTDIRNGGMIASDNKGGNFTSATGKKCIPMFDAITSGYIIPTPTDILVGKKDGRQYFQWPDYEIINFHPPAQMSTHPYVNNDPNKAIPKFQSPWAIQTPKGYSCLITPPLHRDKEIFRIMEGVVDTDTFNSIINFPFYIDPEWEGTIPAGTPMAQVIPFKRESYVMQVKTDTEMKYDNPTVKKLRMSFYNGYRDRFWDRKEYN